MPLNDFAKQIIERFPLGYVATVTEDGMPSLSPKGTFFVLDDETIAFGEIRSPGTLKNLQKLPQTEVNFIDPFKRKAIRIAGPVRMVERGNEEFSGLIGRWHDVWGDLANRVNTLVIIKADRVKPVSTPPYDDGATEEEMIATYKAKYAEIYP